MVDVLLKFNNDFINNLNKALSSFGYSIKIDRLNTDVNGTSPLNDDYREMYLFFYWREMPKAAKDELYSAYKSTWLGSLPKKLCVFFKEPSDDITAALAEFKASFSIRYGLLSYGFNNFDTLKIHFLLQLEDILKRGGLNIMRVANGQLTIGESVLVNLNNVPFVYKNKEYSRLKSLVNGEMAHIDGFKEGCKELERYQNYLLDNARIFARDVYRAESVETRRAYRLFISGNVEEAEEILESIDRQSDYEKNKLCERIENSRWNTEEQEELIDQLADIEFIRGQFMEAGVHSSDRFVIALLQIINNCSFRYNNLAMAIWRLFRRRYYEQFNDLRYGFPTNCELTNDSKTHLHYLNKQLVDLMLTYQKVMGKEELTPEVQKSIRYIIEECS